MSRTTTPLKCCSREIASAEIFHQPGLELPLELRGDRQSSHHQSQLVPDASRAATEGQAPQPNSN